jgi:hypothetical protein
MMILITKALNSMKYKNNKQIREITKPKTVPCGEKHRHGNKHPQTNSETQAT